MTTRTAMSTFDFDSGDPNRLLVECEPEDLFHAVKALERWTARALDLTQSALAYWTGNAVANPRNREGIGEIRSLIRRLQAVQPLDRQVPELDVAARYQHWNGMVAVLEARAHMLDQHRNTADIEGRAHMKELRAALQAADADGLQTQELQQHLKLSPARLSQVLALAEAAGLVERSKQRRVKTVSAAGSWRAAATAASAAPVGAAPSFSPKRGAHLLAA